MRQLIHLWQRFSGRERLLAGVAGAILVLAVLRYGVVDPYRAYVQRLQERIEREADRARQMRERKDSAPDLARHVTNLRQQFTALEARFIPETTPALATAQLQERLQTLAGQSGLELVSAQVMKEQPLGDYRKALVQVTLRGELPALANFLAGIEYGDWLLSVSSLEMRSASGRRSRSRARRRRSRRRTTAQASRSLNITLTVGGVMRQADAS